MKREQTRIITMAIGLVVALAVICSQFFCLPHDPAFKKNTADQHQTEQSEDEIFFSTPSTSLPSSAHVELNPTIFFLFEILFAESTYSVPELTIAIPLGQFFRNVFGLTISPNAP